MKNLNCKKYSHENLIKTKSGKYRIPKAVSKDELLDLVLELVERDDVDKEKLASPDHVRRYLKLKLSNLDYETFNVIYLDAQNQVIGFEQLFRGTIDCASVWPREVIKHCLNVAASACILVHNHPSGATEPSAADMNITERIKNALQLVDIRCVDHLIVAGNQITSFAERGLL